MFTSGACCEDSGPGCSRESLFKVRLRSILKQLGCQYPSMFPLVDFWRPAVVSKAIDACGNTEFPDNQHEVWVRLAEQVSAFVYVKTEKFYQADQGVVRMRVTYVLVPEGMGIRGDDHVIIAGLAYMVTESEDQTGVTKLKIELAKSRFRRPGRTDHTYRELETKAAIL